MTAFCSSATPAFLSLVHSSFCCFLPATPLSANAVSVRNEASALPSSPPPPLERSVPSCSSQPQQPGAVPCAAKLSLCAPAVSPALAMFSDAIAAFQHLAQKAVSSQHHLWLSLRSWRQVPSASCCCSLFSLCSSCHLLCSTLALLKFSSFHFF